MKLDFSKIIGIATLVGSLVKTAQELKGKTGVEKHDTVVDQVEALLPAIEGVTGADIADNDLYLSAVSKLIAAEKAVLVARSEFAALIADIKKKRS